MVGLLAETSSSAPVVVFFALAALVLGSWGWTKYRDFRAEKRSEDLRNLYASVHSDRITNHGSRITAEPSPTPPSPPGRG